MKVTWLLVLVLLAACGHSAELPLPPVRYVVPVPATNDTGGACPEGYLAKTVMMRFWQNGAPKQLELECVREERQ